MKITIEKNQTIGKIEDEKGRHEGSLNEKHGL